MFRKKFILGFLSIGIVFIVSALLINNTSEPAFAKEKKQTKSVPQKKDVMQNRVISEKLIIKNHTGDATISPDGKRTAYVSSKYIPKVGDRQFVVVDGKEGEKYDEIMHIREGVNILFSPDSKRVAYVAKNKGKH
jgi:dipeptidyl aminopeptidase/acylaminoacyl peptidase